MKILIYLSAFLFSGVLMANEPTHGTNEPTHGTNEPTHGTFRTMPGRPIDEVCRLGIAPPVMVIELMPVTVSLQAPHGGFGLQIERVVRKGGELHVLAKAIPPEPEDGVIFALVITEISDTVKIESPVGKINAYVYNRTWSWDDDRVTSLKNAAEFDEKAAGGEAVKIIRPAKEE